MGKASRIPQLESLLRVIVNLLNARLGHVAVPRVGVTSTSSMSKAA